MASACCALAGRVKTEIIHFLANTFTLHKFRDQRQVLGSELVLTDFDEAEMSVQSVLDFMAQAKADNKSPAVVSLRAREGTTLNLLRMYGEACLDTRLHTSAPPCVPASFGEVVHQGSRRRLHGISDKCCRALGEPRHSNESLKKCYTMTGDWLQGHTCCMATESRCSLHACTTLGCCVPRPRSWVLQVLHGLTMPPTSASTARTASSQPTF